MARLATVNMNVDKTRRDDFPRRVDNPRAAEISLGSGAYFFNDAIGQDDIANFVPPTGWVYHSSVLDHDLGHACLAL